MSDKKFEDKKRVNLYMSDELLKKVDNYAAEMCINRSAAIAIILSQFFKQSETLDITRQMMSFLEMPAFRSFLENPTDSRIEEVQQAFKAISSSTK